MTYISFPVGDFLIRVKNASLADNKVVVVRSTKFVKAVAEALKKEGFLSDVKKEGDDLTVTLAYHKKKPMLMDLKLVSRPGLRIYHSADEIEKMKGPEILIISTPEGVMSARDAVKKRVGGELLAKVW